MKLSNSQSQWHEGQPCMSKSHCNGTQCQASPATEPCRSTRKRRWVCGPAWPQCDAIEKWGGNGFWSAVGLEYNSLSGHDEPNFCQSVCQVAQNLQGVASQWPDRVALVGWAADLRADQGYKGFWMKVAGRWQSVFNPVEALSDCIDAEMQFHSLATLLPKDPMVEMSLEVT